jgi:hypothetical protein
MKTEEEIREYRDQIEQGRLLMKDKNDAWSFGFLAACNFVLGET